MAGSEVTIMANQVETARIGLMGMSLTNFAHATAEPQIAAGSWIEVAGTLFEFTALESITGWAGIANSSEAYIRVVPAGASITAEWTTTAPTWSTSKQAWYDATETKRYFGGCYKDSGGNYTLKWLLVQSGVLSLKMFGDGTLKALGAITVTSLTLAGAIAGATTGHFSGSVEAEGGIIAGHGNIATYKKVIDLGARDMSGDNISWGIAFPAGITLANYRGAKGVIIDDAGNFKINIPMVISNATPSQYLRIYANAAQIILVYGYWGAGYSSIANSRGYLIVEYV